jgi:rod shape-determining protein MreB
MLIGESTAERVKVQIGAARMAGDGPGRTMRIKGRDLLGGYPAEVEVNEAEITGFLAELVGQIAQAVRMALEKTEPELAADLCERGIVMTGGGSLLARIDEVLAEATGLPVIVAENALICVALGAGQALEDPVYRGVMSDG